LYIDKKFKFQFEIYESFSNQICKVVGRIASQ